MNPFTYQHIIRLPDHVRDLIVLFAHPVHPCKEDIEGLQVVYDNRTRALFRIAEQHYSFRWSVVAEVVRDNLNAHIYDDLAIGEMLEVMDVGNRPVPRLGLTVVTIS